VGARLAIIDVGTNTILLLVVERGADGGLRPVHDECRFGRLGKGVDASGALDPESVARSLAIVRDYRATIDRLGAGEVVAVGTQALREASNAAAFVGPAEAILGAGIEVIAGGREAELVAAAVAGAFPALAGADHVIADVGGGSTEIIARRGGRTVSAVSVPLGSVRQKERHLRGDPPTAEEARALIADIDGVLAGLDLPTGVPLVATAGTATTIAAVELRLRVYDPDRVQGLELDAATVERQLARYLELPLAERRRLPGLEPERADVIAAGVAIFARLLRRLDSRRFIVSDRGVRWGIAYQRLLPRAS